MLSWEEVDLFLLSAWLLEMLEAGWLYRSLSLAGGLAVLAVLGLCCWLPVSSLILLCCYYWLVAS